ncbi:MAG: ASPIC/UnbV domain-containing protein, partial [Gammaproteobacteria bacterium]|nr:ASPIC/UnbV domain-containing protein [Gammaproteobacteria bacterium]
GLENYLGMSSYTYIDYDNDADLDIIAVSIDGPVWIYTNNTQENHGIIFELDDHQANRSGIGSRIIIHYGEGGTHHQIREIKASGGFVSFDAPRAHFGLGEHEVVSRVEVVWSSGETTRLNGEFKAGHNYKIERR